MVKFLLARGKCLTLTLSLGVIPCHPANIAVSDILLETRFFGLHSCRRKYRCIYLQPLLRNPSRKLPISVNIMQRLGLLKVTNFGTEYRSNAHMDLILLIINNNLRPILHRFRDIASERSKIAIFCYLFSVQQPPPKQGFPWDDLRKILRKVANRRTDKQINAS